MMSWLEPGIKTPEDLRGKNIRRSSIGGTVWMGAISPWSTLGWIRTGTKST